ncbi:MAG TPA: hypothetical protein VF554_11265 [Thermoanaerobaculia bacterium]
MSSTMAHDHSKARMATIHINHDEDGRITGALEPVTDHAESRGKILVLSRSAKHYAHWVVSPPWLDVNVEIVFKDGTQGPFDGPFQMHGKHVVSPQVKPDADHKSHEYAVNVTDNKTKKVFVIDPEIKVVP